MGYATFLVSCLTISVVLKNRKTNSYQFFAGAFGAGVVADIHNNPAKYGVEIFADCRVSSGLEDEELGILIDPKHRISHLKHPILPVFVKTAQFGNIERQDALEVDKASSPFVREQRRCRSLAGKLLGPVIYDIVKKREERIELSDDFYIMQYLEGENLHRLLALITDEWIATMNPLLRKLKLALQNGSQKTVKQIEQELQHEGWIRVRSFFNVIDSALGIVNRLWSRNLRHCDLHPGNIMATIENVLVDSVYFKVLIRKGRGVAPIDLEGYQLSDISALKRQLKRDGIRQVRFFVLHPRRFRLIDLAYLISIRHLKQKVGENLACPCRTGSADRQEDSYELERLWKCARNASIFMNRNWQQMRAANEFNLMASTSSAKDTIDVVQDHVIAMIEAVDDIYKVVYTQNAQWVNCRKNVEGYRAARKKRNSEGRQELRKSWNTMTKFRCTVTQEQQGLWDAQNGLLVLAEQVLTSRIPDQFSVGVVGQKPWPNCPTLPEDAPTVHLTDQLSASSKLSSEDEQYS